jgi:putative oxidoreductase
MAQITRRDPLFIPALGPVYDGLKDIAYPLLRVVMGFVFVPHGMQKLFGMFGAPPMERYLQAFGGAGPWAANSGWVTYIGLLEFVGGIFLMVGFLTRVVAVQFVVFMVIAAFVVHWPNGFFWPARGFELPLTWAFICLAIVIHGGGKWSVDRALGREI